MSDEKTAVLSSDDKPADAGKVTKLASRLKTILGTLGGLLSGAFMMYVSPLLEKAISPSKPVANFGVEYNGLTVTFSNQSSNGSEGWLDFGDGTPLEPISPKQTTVTHTYSNPDNYLAKLTWRSLLGDENERTVKIELESPHTDPPTISLLEATPISVGAYAPATFRVECKTKGAKVLVWDCGDDRNLAFCTETPDCQDHFITFKKAGGYMIKVAAVNGEQAVQKSTIVYVDEPPPGSVEAVVTVTDQGTRVDKVETPMSVTASFPPHAKDNVYSFDRQIPAKQGFSITDARLEPVNDKGSRNVNVKIADDKQSVHLTGELVKDGGGLFNRSTPLPSLLMRVILTQQRQVPVKRPPIPVTGTLTAPGAVVLSLPPLPSTWTEPQRQLRLELRDGDRVVWPEGQLPHAAALTLNNRPCTLTATGLDSQVRVELAEVKPSPSPPPAAGTE
jgi:PKD repeat protein